MKCDQCEKPATFHITDLTSEGLVEVHLCADCAKTFLHNGGGEPKAELMTNVVKGQLKLEQTAEEMRELDSKTCPVCGISFFEFRQIGRLGCPHDYTFFAEELEPLLLNIHGSARHVGKRPRRPTMKSELATQIIQLRRELREAVENEDYEKASSIRDQIRRLEHGGE